MRWKKLHVGWVEATLATPLGGARSLPKPSIDVFLDGIVGDRHSGIRRVDAREDVLRKAVGIPKGAQMANLRQFSAISADDLARIGAVMKTPEHIPFGLLGENLVISGIPNFSQLSPGCLMTFDADTDHMPSGIQRAVLAIWGPNHPCKVPHQQILDHFRESDASFEPAMPFGKAAVGRRGIVGMVYFPGVIQRGDQVTVWQEEIQ